MPDDIQDAPLPEQFCGWLSLFDIMIRFMAWQLGAVLVYFRQIEANTENYCTVIQNRDKPVTREYVDGYVMRLLNIARRQCEAVELRSALERIELFQVACRSQQFSYQELATQAKVLREAIEAELRYRRFAFVPTDRAQKLDRTDKDWEIIQERFPSAKHDIREAIQCYALDCNTACVFHLMRVAEYGLRALARHLGLRKIGNQKHPLEFAEWGTILSELRGKLKAIQMSQGRNARKAALLKFYADAASQADYLNEIWRKEVSHARGPYNAPEALNALTRTHEFMSRLAERLKEKK